MNEGTKACSINYLNEGSITRVGEVNEWMKESMNEWIRESMDEW